MVITDRVRRAGINWILTMQKEYGQEMGLKCFDVMRQTFGEELVGAVMFGIMEGVRQDAISIRVKDPDYRKIEAIKEIRHLTGMGLKESKDAVEEAAFKDVLIHLSPIVLQPDRVHMLEQSIRNLENAGLTVI